MCVISFYVCVCECCVNYVAYSIRLGKNQGWRGQWTSFNLLPNTVVPENLFLKKLFNTATDEL